jgi:hypothetical protein
MTEVQAILLLIDYLALGVMLINFALGWIAGSFR